MCVIIRVLCQKCKNSVNSSLVTCVKGQYMQVCIRPGSDDIDIIQSADGRQSLHLSVLVESQTVVGICQRECKSPKVVPIQQLPFVQG